MAVTVLHQVGAKPDADSIQQVLRQFGNPAIATHSNCFFKTGPGESARGINSSASTFPRVLRGMLPRSQHAPLRTLCAVLQSWYKYYAHAFV